MQAFWLLSSAFHLYHFASARMNILLHLLHEYLIILIDGQKNNTKREQGTYFYMPHTDCNTFQPFIINKGSDMCEALW